MKYQKWLPDEEVENINALVRYLYDLDNVKFIVQSSAHHRAG